MESLCEGDRGLREIAVSRRAIFEPARETQVCRKTEVLVVGSGPAGVAAVVAAARNDTDTTLIVS
jgi:ribulose 1,5-bisphosphate synthetase/thiazole synthase